MLVKNKGGIVWNLSDKEALKRIAKDWFEIVVIKEILKDVVIEEAVIGGSIEEAREKYSAKYSKDVANNKKNDLEWINSKL